MRFQEVVGRGGFAEVWLATSGGQNLAVKVGRRGGDERLKREAELLEHALTAPHAPSFYCAGTCDDGRRYVAVEYLGGDSLAARMAGREPASRAISIELTAIAAAIDAIHAREVVHRDLKPENLLFRPDGTACLIDYGLAHRRGASPGAGAADSALTRTGEALGTPVYMAPELWLDPRSAGRAADVYAVAVIAYELLTGRPPYGGTPAAVRHGHATGRPPSVADLAGAPAPVDEVLARGLAKNPDERPETASLFVEGLRAALHAANSSSTAVPAPLDQENRTVAAISLRAQADLPAVTRLAESEGALLARSSGDRYLLVVTGASSPAAGVRAAVRLAGRAGPELAAEGPVVIHTAIARVKAGRRGPRIRGDELGIAPPWAADAPIAPVILTKAAARTLEPDESEALDGEFSRPVAVEVATTAVEGHTAPLRGRDDLLSAIARAAGGTTPGLLSLRGEAGLGKSRILQAAAHGLRRTGRAVVALRAAAPGGADPDDLTRGLARSLLRVGPEATTADLDRAWKDLGSACSMPARQSIALVLGAISDDDPAVAATLAAPGALRQSLARGLASALRCRASAEPIALVLDDAHHAEQAVLDATEIATMEPGADLLCLLASSPALGETRPGLGSRAQRFETFKLDELDADDARALLRELLRPATFVPDALVERVCELAAGVPGHLIELARSIHASGAIQRKAGEQGYSIAADRVGQLESLPLLEHLAAQAHQGLPATLVPLAELCATLEPPVTARDVDRVQTALPQDEPLRRLDSGAGLERLVARGVCRRESGGYAPRSPLLAEALRRAAPPERLRGLHRAALASLGAAPSLRSVARHAAGAGNHERAADALVRLGDDARARQRFVEAEGHYSAALDHASLGTIATRARAGRGRVRYRLQQFDKAIGDLQKAREAAEAAGDEALAVELLLEEATARDWCQDRSGALALAEAAFPRAEALGTDRLLGRARLALGVARHRAERLDEALKLLRGAADAATRAGDAETRTVALLVLGPALVYADRTDEAATRFAEAIDACQAAGDDFHLAAALTNRLTLWTREHRFDAAVADLEQCIGLAQRLANPQLERGATFNLAELELWRGRFERSEALAARSRELQLGFVATYGAFEDALLLARLRAAQALHGAREYLAWIDENCDRDSIPASARALKDMVSLAAASIEGTPRPSQEWDDVGARITEASLLDEQIEFLATASVAARTAGQLTRAAELLDRAKAMARESQWWQDRLTSLQTSLTLAHDKV